MTLVLHLAGVLLVAGGVLTAVAASALSEPWRRREAARRARRLRRDPTLANLGDVRLCLEESLTPRQAQFAWQCVAQRRIDTATAWAWLQQRGAGSLVHALAAGLCQASLRRVLRGERAYDDHEVVLLACLARPDLFDLRAPAGHGA